MHYDACKTGFGDCDGEKSNGCEQSLDSLDHCLACDSKCEAPNATSKCGANGCELDACNKGTATGDMMYATGCK